MERDWHKLSLEELNRPGHEELYFNELADLLVKRGCDPQHALRAAHEVHEQQRSEPDFDIRIRRAIGKYGSSMEALAYARNPQYGIWDPRASMDVFVPRFRQNVSEALRREGMNEHLIPRACQEVWEARLESEQRGEQYPEETIVRIARKWKGHRLGTWN